MKLLIRVFAGVLFIGFLYSFSASTMTTAVNNGATISEGFACGVIDGDGGFYLALVTTHSVITNNNRTTLICHAEGAPNSTGHAVHYDDFLCGTFIGSTTDSHETVSADGSVTLRCQLSN